MVPDGYRTQSEDTSPEVQKIIIEGLRKMSVARKLELIAAATRAVQEWALVGVRSRHPRATDRENMLRLASQRLDRATMIAVFGWDPDENGR